jgi:hypothetical protein
MNVKSGTAQWSNVLFKIPLGVSGPVMSQTLVMKNYTPVIQ